MNRAIKLGLAIIVIAAAFSFSGADKAEAHRRGWYGRYARPHVAYPAYYHRRAYYRPHYRPRVIYYAPAYYGGPVYYGGGGYSY